MTDIQGLNPQIVNQHEQSELGATAQVTSQQQTQLYETNIQQVRSEEPPADENYSFTPVLDNRRNTDSTSLGQTYDRFNITSDDFAVGLTTIIATLLHETGQEIRQASREGRAATIQSQAALQRQQAEEVRDGAKFALAAGLTSGSFQIAGGVASIGIAAHGAKLSHRGLNEQQADVALDISATPQNNHSLVSGSLYTSIATPAGSVVSGLGQIASSGLQYQSQLQEVERIELEAERTELQQAQTEQNELVQTTQDILREARQILSSIQSAENQVINRIYSI